MKGRQVRLEVLVTLYPDEKDSKESVKKDILNQIYDMYSEVQIRIVEEFEVEIK